MGQPDSHAIPTWTHSPAPLGQHAALGQRYTPAVKVSGGSPSEDVKSPSSDSNWPHSPTLPSPTLSPTTIRTLPEDFQPPVSSHSLAASSQPLSGKLPQPASASLLDIPYVVSLYDTLPHELQSYLLFQLLKRSQMPVLRFVSTVIQPTFKRDFFGLLPAEISYQIMGYLDLRTMGRCCRVSKRWKAVLDGPGAERAVWKRRLMDELWYNEEEIQSERLNRRHHTIRQNWLHGRYKQISFPAHETSVVTCLQFDTDKIVSGSDDQTMHIYDTKTGNMVRRLSGHDGGVWALQYWKHVLVSGSTDRSVRVWDMDSGQCTHIFEGHTSTVRCLTILTPSPVNGDESNIQPAVPLIVTGSRDATLRVWRLPDPKVDPPHLPEAHANGAAAATTNPYFMHVLTGHSGSVRAIAGYGNILVSGSYDSSVRVWDVVQGRQIWHFTGHREKVYSVGYSHELQRAVSGSMDASVRVWCTKTGAALFSLERHASLVGLLELSPSYVVSAAADSTLRIWSPLTGECLATLTGHSAAITCFHHDPKLNRIVSGSDGGVKVWELSSAGPIVHGRFIRDLISDVAGVWRVRMDERRLVCAVQKDQQRTWFEVLDFD
ncbi:WD40-repeat-containing domain protein, partial [Polychytrium aggregatum]|uniref:WD40-repeat-containing domain protein n=1 Tax=Polychytrium aggregatum TaxID=110093 RepID=UPI0022FDF3DC